ADDLLAYGPDERVFTVDAESGEVRFGDGFHGLRPRTGQRVFASYKFGGGVQGNVGIGAIKASRDPRLQGGYKIENPVPTSGGDLGDTVDDAERQVPRILAHRDRLVTEQDFHDITLATPGVHLRPAALPPPS